MSEMPPTPPTANYSPGQPVKPHRGVMILVLGILSFVVCPLILGIVAWMMGNKDLEEMNAGTMDPEGKGLTQAGKIIGMVNVILVLIGIVIQVLMLVCMGGALAVGAGAG